MNKLYNLLQNHSQAKKPEALHAQTSLNIDKSYYINIAWIIWAIASLFYGIEFIQRVSPTVMANSIMQSLNMNKATYSAVISIYFYACAIAQIPVGYLLDRFSARYLIAFACAIVSLGSFMFSISHHITLLIISRILIGTGSAFAFIGVLKLSGNWFTEKQYPLIVGLTNTLGVMGAVIGEAPYAALVDSIGWKKGMMMISIAGFFISILIWLLIRDHPLCLKNKHNCLKWLISRKKQSITGALQIILKNKQAWITAIYAGLMVAPIIAFGELWAVPFLIKTHHINNFIASELNTLIFVGIAVGGPINGYFASLGINKKTIMLVGNLVALITLSTIICFIHINQLDLSGLLFLFGFSSSSMLLAFSINKERFTARFNATVVGFTNMIILSLGAFFQDATGLLTQYSKINNSTLSIVTGNDLKIGLMILPLTLLINIILLMLIKLPRGDSLPVIS